SQRGVGLPGAIAGQPAVDAGAVAGHHVPRNTRVREVNAAGAVTTRAKRVLTRRSVFGWAMYDWANSAFACTVMAGFFPLFFKQFWNAGVPVTESTLRLGLANGLASFIVALVAPLIGAIADKGRARVRLLGLFTVLGAAMT